MTGREATLVLRQHTTTLPDLIDRLLRPLPRDASDPDLSIALAAAATARDGAWVGHAFAGLVTPRAPSYVDPFGELRASAAGHLMDFVHPLPEMLDAFSGTAEVLDELADTWAATARRLDPASGYLADVARVCADTGESIRTASVVIAGVRGMVKDVVACLVAELLVAVAVESCRVGRGASWIVPRLCDGVQLWSERIATWYTDLSATLEHLLWLTTTVTAELRRIGSPEASDTWNAPATTMASTRTRLADWTAQARRQALSARAALDSLEALVGTAHSPGHEVRVDMASTFLVADVVLSDDALALPADELSALIRTTVAAARHRLLGAIEELAHALPDQGPVTRNLLASVAEYR